MNESAEIIEEIKRLIGKGEYCFWSIGLTTNPKATQEALDHPPCWRMWPTISETKARFILNYFLKNFPPGPSSTRIRRSPEERLDLDKIPYIYVY